MLNGFKLFWEALKVWVKLINTQNTSGLYRKWLYNFLNASDHRVEDVKIINALTCLSQFNINLKSFEKLADDSVNSRV